MRLAFPGLSAALAEKATVVTPNQTLASVAVEQFNREQLAQGNAAWERPRIFSLDAWMSRCRQEARFAVPHAPLLLSPLQERELWRQIIAGDRPDLFDQRAMARLAQRAAGILAEYEIAVEGSAWTEHLDAREFLGWRQKFQARLEVENWITRADLWRLIPEWIRERTIVPGPVSFAALTTISSGLRNLFRALGDSVQESGMVYSNPVVLTSAAEHDMEYVARSVRQLLEQEQAVSIGILVADLPSQLSELTRSFDRVLYPSGDLGEHVHVANGLWREHSLIAHALLILELAGARVRLASAGAIFRSPFIDGAGKEQNERALADVKLRKERELDFTLRDIRRAAWDCDILHDILGKIERFTEKLQNRMLLPAWSSAFSKMLDIVRWPAITQLTEAEQQAMDSWSRALSDLASLGLVSPPVTLQEALSQLETILARPSQRGSWSSPVQVMDADSAEGIEFDHCFVMNANEEAWPRPISLSPLIPYRVQRLYRVPGSDPESSQAIRQRKTDALVACARRVEVSFSGHLSPALRPYTQVAAVEESPIWPGLTAAQSYAAADLESKEDNQGPPLVSSEEVRGGASIIKSQSQCPFKAFAEYRLNARGDDQASIGFDALERGEYLHKALQFVWEELRTKANLAALSDSERLALIRRHVEKAVKEEEGNGVLRKQTSMVERERLVTVLEEWLKIEKRRAMAFTVEQLEEKFDAEFSGLKLRLRMDRVDRLADGSLVLFDYKSGPQTRNKLEGDRPREPQLLLYAASMKEPVSGIYFGEIRSAGVRPVGHGACKHFPAERGTTEHGAKWGEFLEASREHMHELASEFRKGHAAVTPEPGACSYCQMKPVCRIGAAAEEAETEE